MFCMGLLETCYSGPKVDALHPKTTHEGWDSETSDSGANHAVLHAQNDR